MIQILRLLFELFILPAFGNFALPASASVISSGLASYPTVYYDRVAVPELHSRLFFYPAIEQKPMPNRSGVAMQFFGYSAFAANTTAQTEATPGAGQALTQTTGTINLTNYADYISISDKVARTSLTDNLAEGAKLLAFRGAITVDTVINTVVDVEANGDSTTLINVADGSYMSRSISSKSASLIQSVNGLPKENGVMYGIAHSLVVFDLINDSATAGSNDLQKYADTLAPKNPALAGIPASARVGVIGGVEWFQSNNVATQTHWQSSAHTAYFAYVFGKDAVFGSSLGNTDLGEKNFSVFVNKYAQGSQSSDPAGTIVAAAAYNFFFGCSTRNGTVNTFIRIGVESSIGT
jgi:N4-gp56 family major capsid protein